MGIRVANTDFSSYKQAMIDKGISQAEVEASWSDLLVLLHATEDTGRAHAMTEGADKALHELVSDTTGLLRISAAILGAGRVLAHDPRAYGTPEFDATWENTRAAFAKQGVDLPADYRSDRGGFRSAANCLVMPTLIAEIQAA
ncbi:hypothetical protein SAMN02982917_2172 [Azospirillum oryzae]|uniref:Uncharacterized protein n=1 Tax=Azospirillum oryzae TaxID=286727 RepID=A0A1X7EZH1_9PROT|nr:hypothetical protein [Azospirillum oryzae]SMF42982.1 hypothetical protein SAMN02982917_2172 [Azospirillum oryzae]